MPKGWRRRVAEAARAAIASVGVDGTPTPLNLTTVAENAAWHLQPLPTTKPVDVSIIFGTYNRLSQLQRCLTECRKSVGGLRHEFIVCDGGSTDGSREWLAAQPDVVLVGDRGLDGAVAAYNRAFACARGQHVAILNDDCIPVKDVLHRAVTMLNEDARIGQVAIPFERSGRRWLPRHAGHLVASYCVIRMTVAHAVAGICGGLWNPQYRTYGADWELSCFIHAMSWQIAEYPEVGVLDFAHETKNDALRTANQGNRAREAANFYARWPTAGEPNLDAGTADKLAQFVTKQNQRNARVTALQTALAAHDPGPKQPSPQAEPKPERVLHLHLASHIDGQPSQVAALTRLGSKGYVRVPVREPLVGARAIQAAESLQPSVVFLQVQAPWFPPVITQQIRKAANNPDLVFCNWSGDVGSDNAPNLNALKWAIGLKDDVDLTLWASQTHVDMLRSAGVPAAYLQIGYDEEFFFEGDDAEWGSKFRVAFLYHEHDRSLRASLGRHDDCTSRTEAANALRAAFDTKATVGTTFPGLAAAGDAYRKTHLAVSISASNTLGRYTSDRLFRAMACTATAVKRFTGWESFGLKHEENCLLFDSTKELITLAKHWTTPTQRLHLREIGHAGAKLVREHHTWDVRMRELAPLIAAVRSARQTKPPVEAVNGQ